MWIKIKMNRCGSRGFDNLLIPLPHDIMVEILLRLPPRSLLRLKLVCKSWCDLINHPDFIQLHLDHSITNKNPLLLISADDYKRQFLYSLNYYNDDNDDYSVGLYPVPRSTAMDCSRRFWGSCNGLLCLNTQHRGILHIWNPCTHEYHKVPNIPFDSLELVGANLISESFGFGYDSTTDYYKIIWIKSFYIANGMNRRLLETQVHVYTLGLTWKSIGTVPFEVSPTANHAPLFLNGGLHWIATTGCGIGMIICIDIATEEYREISKPMSVLINRDDTMGIKTNVKLITLKGLLCIANNVTDEKSIEVWAMRNYDEPSSWSKLFTIKQPLMTFPYSGLEYFEPLSGGIGSKNGDEIVALVDTNGRRSIVLYNIKEDKTRTIWENTDEDEFIFQQVLTYTESLVTLSKDKGVYNLFPVEKTHEEVIEEIRKEEERENILRFMRPWKKQKKNIYL